MSVCLSVGRRHRPTRVARRSFLIKQLLDLTKELSIPLHEVFLVAKSKDAVIQLLLGFADDDV